MTAHGVECAEENKRQTHRHPEGDCQVQEECQQNKYQHDTGQRIAYQQLESLLNGDASVVPGL